MSPAAFEWIRSRFKTLVTDELELVTVHDNGPQPADTVQNWCRFSIAVDSTTQVATGTARYRSTGSATVNLFAPARLGDAALLDRAATVISAFRGVSTETPALISFTPAPSIIGTAEVDGVWCRRTVRIPFRVDEVVT